ncbi:MAG TPA: hypothetical protein VL285_00190 [Bryobacteraceae bacterium]|jgi:hypothetical protein|nr:hypothetical protein [Bryobacteraceae bacterium]
MKAGVATLSNITLFNTNQLATWDQARDCANRLSAGPIVVGGGVKPETGSSATSGIYRPDWQAGPGGFAEPNFTDPKTGEKYFFLHFRFRNGAEGMNVGLILDKFRRFPNSPAYVLGALVSEADSMAH